MKLNRILPWVWAAMWVAFLFAVGPNGSSQIEKKGQQTKKRPAVDSLVVIHFHPTVQCSCCINVGIFARKGLKEFYAKPYKDSLIIFREHDIDEDSSVANKYDIFWSALGFEKFRGGENEFREIESVWEFCEDEEKFLLNFKKELDEFILGLKKAKAKNDGTSQDVPRPIWKKTK